MGVDQAVVEPYIIERHRGVKWVSKCETQAAGEDGNGPYASLAAMFSNRVRHFDCVINRGC